MLSAERAGGFSWKGVGGSSAWTCLNSIRERPLTHGATSTPPEYKHDDFEASNATALLGVLRSVVPFDELADDRLQ